MWYSYNSDIEDATLMEPMKTLTANWQRTSSYTSHPFIKRILSPRLTYSGDPYTILGNEAEN